MAVVLAYLVEAPPPLIHITPWTIPAAWTGWDRARDRDRDRTGRWTAMIGQIRVRIAAVGAMEATVAVPAEAVAKIDMVEEEEEEEEEDGLSDGSLCGASSRSGSYDVRSDGESEDSIMLRNRSGGRGGGGTHRGISAPYDRPARGSGSSIAPVPDQLEIEIESDIHTTCADDKSTGIWPRGGRCRVTSA